MPALATTDWRPDNRMLEIYRYVLSGRSQKRAARRFEITQGYVSKICSRVDDWLARTYMGQIRQIKANHTQRLEYIYNQAMSAWRRSQRDEVTETETDKNYGMHPGSETKKTRRAQAGAAAFLSEARAAINEIRNIWGANAPLQIEHAGEVRVAGRSIDECRAELLEKVQRLTVPQGN